MWKKSGTDSCIVAVVVAAILWITNDAAAADRAPEWMQALKSASIPEHDEKVDSVVLYSDTQFVVNSNGSMRSITRYACKVLRTDSSCAGIQVSTDAQTKISSLRAWTIPVEGKDYAVKERDFYEVGGGAGFELVTDSREKRIVMPAATVGAIIGYELEQSVRPLMLQDVWPFQGMNPVKESHYTLQLPEGWTYKANWLNYPEQMPLVEGRAIRWNLTDIKAVKNETAMPPYRAVAGALMISFYPSAEKGQGFASWNDVGKWNGQFTINRNEVNREIKDKVASLVAGKASAIDKVKAIAAFVRDDIRYVAVELGIGGLQPHLAVDTFRNRYGDCKDKANLLNAMLAEVGIDSYLVAIRSENGVVTSATPPTDMFNHMVIAIHLPDQEATQLQAVMHHPKLGTLLFFDPTNEYLSVGSLYSWLSGNHALLITKDGGELVHLPIAAQQATGLNRIGRFVLTDNGMLKGEVKETDIGEYALIGRRHLDRSMRDTDIVKTVEYFLGESLASFNLQDVAVSNQDDLDKPLEYKFNVTAEKYAKKAGDLLTVRPHVFGSFAQSFLESTEPRKNDISFETLVHDVEESQITLPEGFVVDELPDGMIVDADFARYQSKYESKAGIIKYTRTFDLKMQRIPVSRSEELRKFYRQIYHDERAMAVLRKAQ